MSEATSVERAFAILETFERERRPMSLKDLSEVCRIPGSTCHSLVRTLLKHGYLYQSGRRKDLYPTRKLYDMGAVIVAHDHLLQRLLPIMEDLRDETRETVILGKRQGNEIIYLEVLEGPQVVRYSARSGDAKPLHSTCIGKAMLAQMPSAELALWLEEHPPVPVTDKTLTDSARLLAELAEGRAHGFFHTRGENVADVSAVGMPVSVGSELFGLAVAGPSHRIDINMDSVSRALSTALDRLIAEGIATRG